MIRFCGSAESATLIGNILFLYLPHFNWREKYRTSSNGIISSLSGLCQYNDNKTLPTIEKLTDKYKELESGFRFCVDHDLINILDLGTFLLMKYGEDKGKKALNKNYYYYKNHIEKLKEKTGKKKISEKEETAN